MTTTKYPFQRKTVVGCVGVLNACVSSTGSRVRGCVYCVGRFNVRFLYRGAEYVSAREWMRICFELLELLKAHKKAIRRATVNTFGYIAKAIGSVSPTGSRNALLLISHNPLLHLSHHPTLHKPAMLHS